MEDRNIWSADSSNEGVVVGIDFGTSNCCVGLWHNEKNRVKIIKNTRKERLTRSTVSFISSFVEKEAVVGKSLESLTCATSFKQYIGLLPDELNQTGMTKLPPGLMIEDGKILMKCFLEQTPPHSNTYSKFSPEELSVLVFKYLKRCAEEYVADSYDLQTVRRAVIGVPVNFSSKRRQAIINAAQNAGFDDVFLMAESTAAALGYGLFVAGTKVVLVFDIGGGTTDATIMRIEDGNSCHVLGSAGHVECGGKIVDKRLMQAVAYSILCLKDAEKLPHAAMANLTEDEVDKYLLKLTNICESCKKKFSNQDNCVLDVPRDVTHALCQWYSSSEEFLRLYMEQVESKESYPLSFRTEIKSCTSESVDGVSYIWEDIGSITLSISREELESLLVSFLGDVKQTVVSAVQDYRSNEANGCNIDEVILVGGCSLLPCVRTAIQSSLQDLGVSSFRNADSISDGRGKDFCMAVNPHECVAHGLAVKGALMMGVKEGKLKELLMIDCVPYSIGVMSHSSNGTVFEAILERGMSLPCSRRKTFLLDESSLQEKKVSLDIYEEIFEANSVDSKVQIVSSCDLPIGHILRSDDDPLITATLDVIFHMSENGDLTFGVDRAECGDCSKDDIDKSIQSDGSTVLFVYIICLAVLYIIIKVSVVGNVNEINSEGGITPDEPQQLDDVELDEFDF